MIDLRHGDCLQVLRTMPDCSVDAIVTDPPYGLSLMNKRWDYDVPSVEVWAECLRVLKPGGHLLAFAGTRTQHRMAVRIEDAGFDIRDMIAWIYGSGFPKSSNVSKAIDKGYGESRDRQLQFTAWMRSTGITADQINKWNGWGTTLKQAIEPITVARKPMIGTVAENVLTHGTGALNIDKCRVGTNCGCKTFTPYIKTGKKFFSTLNNQRSPAVDGLGRWPANLIHDGSDEVLAGFPQTGASKASKRGADQNGNVHGTYGHNDTIRGHDDNVGSAARFFYCAKASKVDRDEGCEGLDNNSTFRTHCVRNHHPTVKPTDLMRYLCKLVTPTDGIVLDPFMGSGSTGKGAVLEGLSFIGIEREAEYIAIAKARINAVTTIFDIVHE